MDIDRYKVIITPTAYREISKMYNYISEDLCLENSANQLMEKFEAEIEKLANMPYMHMQISKLDDLKMNYRRIVLSSYIILYTVEEESKTVFVSHMYYKRKNYLL